MAILFILAALPVVLLGMYIYKKDNDKESHKLLAGLFVGGILSCFLVVFISLIMESIFPLFGADYTTLNLIELFIYVFIGVALVEEFCKFIVVYVVANKSHHFDELYDAIVYCVFASLGFAFFENVLYVIGGGVKTAIIRALLSIPGHTSFGIFMGYFLGLSKLANINGNKQLKNKNFVLSLIVPIILHGIYDYLVMANFSFLFYLFVIILFITSFKLIKKISSIQGKMIRSKYCSLCGQYVDTKYCGNCGTKNE